MAQPLGVLDLKMDRTIKVYSIVYVLLPRITFRFTLPRSGVTVELRQFPLRPCYVSRSDTSRDLLRCERASVCSRTTVRWNEPCQKPARHLDADTADSSARWKGSHEECGLPRASTIFSSRTTSSLCIVAELPYLSRQTVT